ncbi:MAG TPA: transcriptional regulator [Firmicutes bacterium]|nr:transcriptional regulator [Bacillota bacterium]
MAKKANQKKKLLLLMRYFQEETDMGHPTTIRQLIAMLEREEIPAERKSLYDDIAALREWGMPIENRGGQYYLRENTFTLPELKLLTDAVASSRFISEARSRALIRKIAGLTNRFARSQLQRQVYLTGRSKTTNEAALLNVDPLHQAIHCGKKVSFRYFSYVYSPNGTGRWKKEYHHNGQFSVVSPYALVWDDENYYLVGYYERRETVSHFRVDKMEDIRILSDWARPAPAHFVVGDYVGRTFGMFGGNQTQVTLEAENDLMNVFYDRFGKDLTPHRVDEQHFRVVVPLQLSPTFFGWVFQFGGRVQVISPPQAADEMARMARRFCAPGKG